MKGAWAVRYHMSVRATNFVLPEHQFPLALALSAIISDQDMPDDVSRHRIRVGQYNVLCPTYGVKWGEREAFFDWKSKDDFGGSNWDLRRSFTSTKK